MKQRENLVKTVVYTDEVMEYFYDVIEGNASDLAYFELLCEINKHLYGASPVTTLVPYLEMVFGIDEEAFKTITAKAEKHYERLVEELVA